MKDEAKRRTDFVFYVFASISYPAIGRYFIPISTASILEFTTGGRKREKRTPHPLPKAAGSRSCSQGEGLCQQILYSYAEKVCVSNHKSWPISISVLFHTQNVHY